MPIRIDAPILVVYDSRATRETIALLSPESCPNVTEVDSPEDAFSTMRSTPPALVLLCAMTGKTRAYDTCRAIKSDPRLRRLPVMMLTLHDSDEARRRAFEAGADDTLQLSISAEEILEHLQQLLETSSSSSRPAPAAPRGPESPVQIEAAARAIEGLVTALEEQQEHLRLVTTRLRACERALRDAAPHLRREDDG
jgi:two-component system cell cycle response regulator